MPEAQNDLEGVNARLGARSKHIRAFVDTPSLDRDQRNTDSLRYRALRHPGLVIERHKLRVVARIPFPAHDDTLIR